MYSYIYIYIYIYIYLYVCVCVYNQSIIRSSVIILNKFALWACRRNESDAIRSQNYRSHVSSAFCVTAGLNRVDVVPTSVQIDAAFLLKVNQFVVRSKLISSLSCAQIRLNVSKKKLQKCKRIRNWSRYFPVSIKLEMYFNSPDFQLRAMPISCQLIGGEIMALRCPQSSFNGDLTTMR